MKVIFDTNASRRYIARIDHNEIDNHARINAVKMKDNNIELLINPIVVMELMYHLLDKNDKDYYVSYNTIKALVLTMECQCNSKKMPLMSVAECIIARDLFNQRIEEREQMYFNIMSAASYIAHGKIDNIEDFISTDCVTIKEYIDNVENTFVEQIKAILEMVRKNNYPGDFNGFMASDLVTTLLAIYIIRTTYNLLLNENKINSQIRQLLQYFESNQASSFEDFQMLLSAHPEFIIVFKELLKHAQIISDKYPSFITLFKQVIIKVNNGMSENKIKNYIWDILLMFNVTDLTIDNDPVIFVTSDKAMLEAAKISHNNLSIITFEDFSKKYLQ
ncbi:hypothetical protein [Bacteroides sp.]|uniref:hypothetical protein n=1 Tax=Bacteroides sp. TaxID=29523 RepID=UPI002601CB78|nr:hypothetical protein [Bacteroides sp.]MDD3038815.1 hypothetical protein [Bacteroides sp.]